MTSLTSISDDLSLIRKRRPIILNITNYVAMEFSANALLAVGASPLMSLAIDEMEELIPNCGAVVINMGTLSRSWIEIAEYAWSWANQCNIPVVFDPVGVGATLYRTETAKDLLRKFRADIIRGNGSEILGLLTDHQNTKGVDTEVDSEHVVGRIGEGIRERKEVFVVSGSTDYILSSGEKYWVRHGHPRMTQVTATGCVATAVVAAFRSVNSESTQAALNAMAWVGWCGELSAEKSVGPGSHRSAFLDFLASPEVTVDRNIQAGDL